MQCVMRIALHLVGDHQDWIEKKKLGDGVDKFTVGPFPNVCTSDGPFGRIGGV